MNTAHQFLSFCVMGAAATAVHYVILIVMVQAGIAGVVAASTYGFVAGAIVSYALNRQFTFRSERPHAHALPRFFLVASFGVGVNAAVLWIFHAAAGMHYLTAQLLATGAALLWNFAANRAWTFAVAIPPRKTS